MLRILPLIAALLIPAQALAGPSEEAALSRVMGEYAAFQRMDDPIAAGMNGDRQALSRLPDVTPAADAVRRVTLAQLAAELAAIDAGQLSDEGQIDHAILRRLVEERLQAVKLDDARLAFSNDGGFHTLMDYVATVTPMDSEADADAYATRLEALSEYYEDNIANLRRGVQSGFTQPASTTELVLAQARRQTTTPIDQDPLLAPLKRLPSTVSTLHQVELLARGQAAIEKLRVQQDAFVAFLETEYLPAARAELGIGSVPGGREYYEWAVRRYTTTDKTPDEIHAIGLAEVARIRDEMTAVMAETGFEGAFPEFLAFLRADPRFYAATREELLEKASEIAKRIDDKLPRWFATLPRLTYGVRPVPAEIEEDYTTGRYFPGSPRLGVAGGYMVNTSHLDQRPLYELPALTLHEAVPGHHLQIALAQELTDTPAFRRDAEMSAFVEGWGLYAETLGGEMGVYRDAYERFGRLSYEMWRACRLVADTGIHWMGWTLDEARRCFAENSALAPHNIETELARYVSWPGQALAYKIGEMKILELRSRAKTELGEAFDIRRFHDAVLLAGPLPLDLLEQRIDRWIAAEKAR